MLQEIRALLIPVVIVAVIVIRWSLRQKNRAKHHLEKRQRAVYIQQQWLYPVIETLFVGGVLWADLNHGWLPWVAAVVGLIIGLPLGAYRGKFMYVRSVEDSHKVVVERNFAEIGILLGVYAIKLIAESISHNPNSLINLGAVVLLCIVIASSFGRVAYITYRHYQSRHIHGAKTKLPS